MNRKLEQELEFKIASKVVDCLLSAGYKITVNDGDDDVLKKSVSKKLIMEKIKSTEKDGLQQVILYIYKNEEKDKFVYCTWGNAEDVICDYSTSLATIIKPALNFSEKYS
jgi:hypothetical protein